MKPSVQGKDARGPVSGPGQGEDTVQSRAGRFMLALRVMKCWILLTQTTQKSSHFFPQGFKASNYNIIILLHKKKTKTLNGMIENRPTVVSLKTRERPVRKVFSKQEVIMMVPLGMVRRGQVKHLGSR